MPGGKKNEAITELSLLLQLRLLTTEVHFAAVLRVRAVSGRAIVWLSGCRRSSARFRRAGTARQARLKQLSPMGRRPSKSSNRRGRRKRAAIWRKRRTDVAARRALVQPSAR